MIFHRKLKTTYSQHRSQKRDWGMTLKSGHFLRCRMYIFMKIGLNFECKSTAESFGTFFFVIEHKVWIIVVKITRAQEIVVFFELYVKFYPRNVYLVLICCRQGKDVTLSGPYRKILFLCRHSYIRQLYTWKISLNTPFSFMHPPPSKVHQLSGGAGRRARARGCTYICRAMRQSIYHFHYVCTRGWTISMLFSRSSYTSNVSLVQLST